MKKKKLFIVLMILGILLLIPVSFTIIDKIRYDNGKSAIFVKESGGCEEIIYAGVFYSIHYSVPQIGPEDDSGGDNSSWVWFWEH
ncbi:hypothetical protein SAMN02745136_00967 [Anaerocolumna jejuensis DSM 15929]|uniref:Uncharacterized protein n=1 Tax=Anaerocolumna jejuensis DSM 15929 TaxID=1121322 RepID=A0A1M6ME06_9FIRM|nr:hypothetical protein [Anaerocolumna jejuensis]SHJ81695.1 hypothetical protein SAMN02745136_00967 [Anaerocolumna jejuensis DSM 15929]